MTRTVRVVLLVRSVLVVSIEVEGPLQLQYDLYPVMGLTEVEDSMKQIGHFDVAAEGIRSFQILGGTARTGQLGLVG